MIRDLRSKAVNETVKGTGRTRREFPWVSSCQFIRDSRSKALNKTVNGAGRTRDENFDGLVAVNSLETYLVRLSIKLLKELVEHDDNFLGLVPVNSLETYVVRLSMKL